MMCQCTINLTWEILRYLTQWVHLTFKGFVCVQKEMIKQTGKLSRQGGKLRHWLGRSSSYIAPDQATPSEEVQQGRWANLPPELLLAIIRRVEASETSWPGRKAVVCCAAVCRSWRKITKDIVQTPEQCGRLTFPISLKQPGPRDFPVQCFIRRDKATSVFYLFYGSAPSKDGNDKLLLAARRTRKGTRTAFAISLVADDFSRASNAYVGKLRSNLLHTKFTIYDNHPHVMLQSKQTVVDLPTGSVPSRSLPDYRIATVSYELNILHEVGPIKSRCIMHSIPLASIQEGGSVPTPKCFPNSDEQCDQAEKYSSTSISEPPPVVSGDPLILKNKAPIWHDQLCWCLNFRGRVTVASVKNFQLVAAVESHQNVPAAEKEKVILQFGKIGKDIFTMDYCYPLSAFQAFAISLPIFDPKPACEGSWSLTTCFRRIIRCRK